MLAEKLFSLILDNYAMSFVTVWKFISYFLFSCLKIEAKHEAKLGRNQMTTDMLRQMSDFNEGQQKQYGGYGIVGTESSQLVSE